MSAIAAVKPEADEYAPYYGKYVNLVPAGDIVATLDRQLKETLALLGGIPAERADYRYAPGKWNLKEVLGHVIDTERIFAYRALRFARGDRTPLPGFDQDVYASAASFGARPLEDVAREYEHVRSASLDLFRSLDEAAWLRRGAANENEVSVRALAYITAGHETHHVRIIRTQYL